MSKIGVNSPCPCGSHKKFKKCCLVTKNTGGSMTIKAPAVEPLEKMGFKFIKPKPPIVELLDSINLIRSQSTL